MTSFQKQVVTLVVSAACALVLAACGGGDSPSVTGPSVGTSVTVSFPGGPVYIGSTTQFEAREALGNGTTRVPTSVAWSSDKLQVAAVSTAGVVSAIGAGEATISAEVNGIRGSLPIRVLPDFGGAWSGTETVVSCVDSGQLSGFCSASQFVGQAFLHESSFTQNMASVTGVLDAGDGARATMTGTITVDGDLPLGSATVLPADPDVTAQVENWRSRADTPSRMTGTYEVLFTIPGVTGSARIGLRLDSVTKISASASDVRGRTGGSKLRSRFRSLVQRHG
jgi:Big-like domain-containing protein